MDEGERADDDVDGVVGQRQLVERGEAELAARDPPPRVREHVR